MKVVFGDAFYFVAWLNARDQHHQAVISFSRTSRAKILTTEWILFEVADALAASECRTRIRDFVSYLRSWQACEIVAADRVTMDRALALYHNRIDKGWTLTDCTSFVLMKDRNIVGALTADHHFEQAGFVALLK